MINRVLIRIKVIQMLYSYLLTEKLFMLESQPTPPTKEKRFAYKLYLDMLTLMTDIADAVQMRGKNNLPLKENRFIKMLLGDEKIKTIQAKNRKEPYPYSVVVNDLAEIVKDSGAFKSYMKEGDFSMSKDLKVWQDIFTAIMMTYKPLADLFAQQENYSMRGVERMTELVNTTFLNFSSSQDNLFDAIKTLNRSLDKSYELYFRLLLLPVELTNLREQQIDANRHKFLPSDEDVNPNLRFVENGFVAVLRENAEFNAFVEENKLAWNPEDRILLNILLKNIMDSDIYADYMSAEESSLVADCEFWRNVYKHIIFQSPDLEEVLEEKSVFWNDDLDIIGTFVLKTVKRIEAESGNYILPKFKDEEDARFGKELFQCVVKSKDDYRAFIDEFVKKDSWDSDRLAFMDVVLILTTIAEILNFPKIPVTVSLNEYIELAKAYSTPKSSQFLNGILASIIAKLRAEKKLIKE